MKKFIPIIMGEPRSINTEIIYKSLNKLKKTFKNKIVLIGSYDLLKDQLKLLKKKIRLNKLKNINDFKKNDKINILNIPIDFSNPFKINSQETKKYILNSLILAHNLSVEKKIDGFINCPIDKKVFNKNIGVTEFLSKLNRSLGTEVMMIYNEKFAVVPLTTHIDVKKVSQSINQKKILSKIRTLNFAYKEIFNKQPVIKVLGLNPHNGEMRKNSEESKIIFPAVNKLKNERVKISGPFSVDEVFLKTLKDKEVVVGMYHDQVLAPFKALNKFNAINITLGLKYLRISPDHGTGAKIVFKNQANPESLLKAIDCFNKF
tara:strand:+ start:4452 stop:5405 length:954 start_codon:yes stop_codon:yes gene_type:complete